MMEKPKLNTSDEIGKFCTDEHMDEGIQDLLEHIASKMKHGVTGEVLDHPESTIQKEKAILRLEIVLE